MLYRSAIADGFITIAVFLIVGYHIAIYRRAHEPRFNFGRDIFTLSYVQSGEVRDRRRVVVIRREKLIRDKPFCADTDNQPVIDIAETVAVEPHRSRGHTDTISLRKGFIYALVALGERMMILVCNYQRGSLHFLHTTGYCLNHADSTVIHVNSPADKRALYLVNELLSVDKEQDTVSFPCRTTSHISGDAALSTAAGQNDAGGSCAVRPCFMDTVDYVNLILSELLHFSPSRRSSYRACAHKPRLSPRLSARPTRRARAE